jgi:thioredoxin 1
MVAYITELNSNNFDDFIKEGYSLVDVWAPWCGPCKMISSIIDEVSSIYVGKLSVGKLNADDNRDLVMENGVRNIPTLLFFKDGQPLLDSEDKPVKMVGNTTSDKLKEFINSILPTE